jgi:hypothetical protein
MSKAKSSQTPDSRICRISNAVSCKEPVDLKEFPRSKYYKRKSRCGSVGVFGIVSGSQESWAGNIIKECQSP